jgi:hypothetical protein
MRRRTFRSFLVPLGFLFISALWLAQLVAHPGQLLIWRGAAYSDILISHWPNAYYLKHSLQTWGQIPLWNSMIFSGMPFAADPLAGLWYPPNWLVMIMPIQLAFNILFWLHLAWAGWGMYRWMKDLGLGTAGAFVAGLAWCGTSKWFAHIGLGHLTFVCAVSWTPWALQLLGRTLHAAEKGWRNWLRWAGLTGLVFGVSFLADPRWIVPLCLLSLVVAVHYLIQTRFDGSRKYISAIRPIFASGAVTAAVAVGMAAALLLPMIELVSNSSRAMLTVQDMTTMSLPFSHLAGILFPFFDQPEWLAYAGFVVLQLAIVAVIAGRLNARFWLGVVLVSWLLALGDHFPLYRVLVEITPGMKFLRIPPRFIFLASLGLAVLAGIGVEQFLRAKWSAKELSVIRLSSLALSALAVSMGVGIWSLSQEGLVVLVGISLLAVVTFLWIQISTRRPMRLSLHLILWVLLIAIDSCLIGGQVLELQSMDEKLTERYEVAAAVGTSLAHRVFSPSYSIPQQTAAGYHVELADGVNPLQLQHYKAFLATAAGFSADEYSVSLPPFPAGEPGQARELDFDVEKLGLLNVAAIVSDFPIEAEHIVPDQVVNGVYIYRNEKAMPRAWMINDDIDALVSEVKITRWTPNQIQLIVQGPGRLILSEVDYPGWQVDVDGDLVELQRAYDLLRSVEIPDGQHNVRFSFNPLSVRLGVLLSILSLLSAVVLWVKR